VIHTVGRRFFQETAQGGHVGNTLDPNSKPILPTTRQGYDGRCPLALSKV